MRSTSFRKLQSGVGMKLTLGEAFHPGGERSLVWGAGRVRIVDGRCRVDGARADDQILLAPAIDR